MLNFDELDVRVSNWMTSVKNAWNIVNLIRFITSPLSGPQDMVSFNKGHRSEFIFYIRIYHDTKSNDFLNIPFNI